jgi:hypothetical protein
VQRRFSLVMLTAAAAATSLISTALAEDARMPERKAGLWELSTTMDEGLGPKTQSLTMCIDADMERTTLASSAEEHKRQCSKHEITREGDKTVVNMSCQFASRQVVSKTELSGDFATSLLVKIESTTSGDQDGKTVMVKRTITQTGKYLGESCGDLAAGEAKGQDGSRILVQ